MNRIGRLVGVVLLVVALFGLGAYADVTENQRWPYPQGEDLAADYDRYVGQETLVFGTVEEVGDTDGTIRVDHDHGSVRLTVRNFDAAVQPGGSVQVYGTLADGHTIDARRVTVVNPAAGSTLFKYVVSIVAVVLFLAAFFRYWCVNVRAVQLESRRDG